MATLEEEEKGRGFCTTAVGAIGQDLETYSCDHGVRFALSAHMARSCRKPSMLLLFRDTLLCREESRNTARWHLEVVVISVRKETLDGGSDDIHPIIYVTDIIFRGVF